MDSHHYRVDVNWEGDRKGRISSPVLRSTIEVATPPEFTKGVAGIWSPEHLLVAAVNSCLMTTFLAISENSGFRFANFESKADGKLENIEGRFMISEILLSPTVTIHDEKDREKAIKILQKSKEACLISNSIKSIIIFQPSVQIFNN